MQTKANCTHVYNSQIFEGANGYYVAWQDGSGFHRQPESNGARIGWDRKAAERELRELLEDNA